MTFLKRFQRGHSSGSRSPPAFGAASKTIDDTADPLAQFLLHLPPLALLRVLQYLTLDSQLLLAETCHVLREHVRDLLQDHPHIHLTHAQVWLDKSKGTRLQLSSTRRIEYLVDISRDAPGYWLCCRCLSLHRISFKDGPSSGISHAPLCVRNNSPPPLSDIWLDDTRFESATHYSYQEHHKQIILKYARLYEAGALSNKQQRYLSRLLEDREFFVAWDEKNKTCCWLDVEPQVTQQQRQPLGHGANTDDLTTTPHYKLLTRHCWYVGRVSHAVRAGDVAPIRLCPHMKYSPLTTTPSQATQEGLFIYNVHEAIRINGRPVRGSCQYCRLDYFVKATPAEKLLKIIVWYDVTPSAPGVSPQEQHLGLMSFNWSEGRNSGRRTGDIRKMYEEPAQVFPRPVPQWWHRAKLKLSVEWKWSLAFFLKNVDGLP